MSMRGHVSDVRPMVPDAHLAGPGVIGDAS